MAKRRTSVRNALITPRVGEDRRGKRDRIHVEVIGSRGTFAGYRRDFATATATARLFAALLDAPRGVL